MAMLTRRGLIRQTTLGTAAAGALMVAPGRAFARTSAAEGSSVAQTPDRASSDVHVPLGAYVHDVAAGEITLLLGTREQTVRDPDLVRRLVQAAR